MKTETRIELHSRECQEWRPGSTVTTTVRVTDRYQWIDGEYKKLSTKVSAVRK